MFSFVNFSFLKRKVVCVLAFTSFLFYGQAVRPGLIAFRAVKPEMHTGPARKGWTSLNISGRSPEMGFHAKTTFWRESEEFPLQIYG